MAKNRVIILAPESDVHARAVAQILEKEIQLDPHILDLSRFCSDSQVSWRCEGGEAEFRQPQGSMSLEDVVSVWYRRPQRPRHNPIITDSNDRIHAANEWNAAFNSILRSCVPRWINPMEADFLAGKKPYQLNKARDIGLPVPRTLITNSADEVREFREACDGRVIFKSLSAHPNRLFETRVLTDEAVSHLGCLYLAPTIFQEQLDTKMDLRVTMMGDEVFAVAIHSADSEYPQDSRLDLSVKHEPVDLDAEVESQLRKLMKELCLVYGAVDLIETKSGQLYFLEVNPSGQFLYIELLTELPLSQAMARLLGNPPCQEE